MAMTPVQVPPFPDVPRSQGVPSVFRQLGAAENTIATVVADVASIARLFEGPQWGIFDQAGAPVLLGDSVVALDFRQDYRVSDYPIEEGGFASYNKVQQPFDIRVSFAVSGQQSLISSLLSGGALGSLISGISPNISARSGFLTDLNMALKSLYLFSVVTPEMTYDSVNLTHCDYRRESRRGVTLLVIDVWCQEIRVAARGTYSGTKDPTGTEPIDSGPTQPASVEPNTPATGTGTGGPPDTPVDSSGIGATSAPVAPRQTAALPSTGSGPSPLPTPPVPPAGAVPSPGNVPLSTAPPGQYPDMQTIVVRAH